MKSVKQNGIKSQVKMIVSTKILLLIGIFLLFNISIAFFVFIFQSTPGNIAHAHYEDITRKIVERCREDDGWRNCYGNEFADLTEQTDLKTTLYILNLIQDIDEKVRDCHIPSHKIMSSIMEKNPEKWEEYLDIIDPNACNYGFVHGLLESKRRYDNNFVLTSASIVDFCNMLVSRKMVRGLDQSCSHIMGHLVLVEKEANVSEAAKVCAGMPYNLQRECYGGVFMENYTRDNLVVHGLAEYAQWDEKLISDQEKLCNSYTDIAALGCWQEISSMYLNSYPYDPENYFELCSRAPNQELIDACYLDGLNSLMVAPDADEQYYSSLCSRYESSLKAYDRCLQMAVRSVIGASEKNIDKTLVFCSSVMFDARSACYGIVGDSLRGQVIQSLREQYCKKSPPEYQNSCLNSDMRFQSVDA